MSPKLNFLIEHDEAGFHLSCPEVPGCDARGPTLDEVLATICGILGSYWGVQMADDPQLLDDNDMAATIEILPTARPDSAPIQDPSGPDPR